MRAGYQLYGVSPMNLESLNLGERIVLVTRLAVQAHLQRLAEENASNGRRAAAGGAGFACVTDDFASLDQRLRPTCAPLVEGAVG